MKTILYLNYKIIFYAIYIYIYMQIVNKNAKFYSIIVTIYNC